MLEVNLAWNKIRVPGEVCGITIILIVSKANFDYFLFRSRTSPGFVIVIPTLNYHLK